MSGVFTTDDIKKRHRRHDEVSKRPRPRNASASPIAYRSLDVVKPLAKAKFPVYLTSSRVNNKQYAMKIYSHQGEKLHPSFQNECRFMDLQHPNIIEVVHCEDERKSLQKGKLKKVSYILMEYAPYGDLFTFVSMNSPNLDEKLIRAFFRQLIDGVEYLHDNGIAHLDLKPQNLLVGADFNLKIADFDLSHVKGDPKILSRGTKFCRGPELYTKGADLKHPFACDIYSAGIILFVLKSGGVYAHSEDAPFQGLDFLELMHEKNDEFWEKHAEVQGKDLDYFDKDFRELFNGMTKENPEDRFTLKQIKQSKWYNGAVYAPLDYENKMKDVLKC